MLSIEDVLALEAGDSFPPKNEILEKNIKTVQSMASEMGKNGPIFQVQAAEGQFLNLTESALNELINGNRAYRKILAAATKKVAVPPEPVVPDNRLWNSRILNVTPFLDVKSHAQEIDAPNTHQFTDFAGT
jgi:hypothetical protein